MAWSRMMLAASLMTMLAACSSVPKDKLPDVKSTGPSNPYPALPADQTAGCYVPPVSGGDDAIVDLGVHRVALKRCDLKHKRLVRWYNSLRKTKG